MTIAKDKPSKKKQKEIKFPNWVSLFSNKLALNLNKIYQKTQIIKWVVFVALKHWNNKTQKSEFQPKNKHSIYKK